ncbi:hypothetical protein V4R08_15265 [Nitrobacter sp. NHB1]|uniref:hypothetical protein n=1 Tax=Nitrobacter sp. NHB1 TaxID=3119830 RepID=UPI0030004E4C
MMSRIRGKGTKPELLVRSAAHGLGFRFRLHVKKLPGSPDVVFPAERLLYLSTAVSGTGIRGVLIAMCLSRIYNSGGKSLRTTSYATDA